MLVCVCVCVGVRGRGICFRITFQCSVVPLELISNTIFAIHVLYVHPNKVLEATAALELWLSSNRLRLNADKTQFIWHGGRAQLTKIGIAFLRARFPDVHFSDLVRDLGVTLDPVLSLSDHVNPISRTCLYHLRQLRTIRHSLFPTQ